MMQRYNKKGPLSRALRILTRVYNLISLITRRLRYTGNDSLTQGHRGVRNLCVVPDLNVTWSHVRVTVTIFLVCDKVFPAVLDDDAS